MKKRLLTTLFLSALLMMSCTEGSKQSNGTPNGTSGDPTQTSTGTEGDEGGNTGTGTGTTTTTDGEGGEGTGTSTGTDGNTQGGEGTGTNTGTGGNTQGGNTEGGGTGTGGSGTNTEDDGDEFVPQKLDCNYMQMELPSNVNNPNVIETSTNGNIHWWENEMYDSFPDNFSGIYGNNSFGGQFYSVNNGAPGGFKVDQRSKGFQTSAFTVTGLKLEIRFLITQVNTAGGNPDESKETGDIYYFNSKGKVLGKHTIEKGTITTQKTGQYIRFYVTESYVSEISYMEFRIHALPFKGQQNYNFGVGYFNICSWAYGA